MFVLCELFAPRGQRLGESGQIVPSRHEGADRFEGVSGGRVEAQRLDWIVDRSQASGRLPHHCAVKNGQSGIDPIPGWG